MDLLTECRAAAPAWLADEDWTSDEVGGDVEWSHPRNGHGILGHLWAEQPDPTCYRVRALLVIAREPAVRFELVVSGQTRLAPALAFVAGELRAEMVRRGMAEAPHA